MVRREREIKKEREESRQERRGNREVRREKREESREQREERERRGKREVRRDLVVPKMHTFPKDALVALSVVRKPRKNWHSMKPAFRNFPRFA